MVLDFALFYPPSAPRLTHPCSPASPLLSRRIIGTLNLRVVWTIAPQPVAKLDIRDWRRAFRLMSASRVNGR